VRDPRVLEQNSGSHSAHRSMFTAAREGDRDEVESELVEIEPGSRGIESESARLKLVIMRFARFSTKRSSGAT
jgi:hypothetical protein